ncbi:superkiller [Kluyveromyces marxianus]|nr:superkiller [Kluyveromyces marxianus]KAG0685334.1 superkiller [Kluyveromyces marxianus]
MSKLFIPTTNCGKAHKTDIYGMTITNPYTISCSGDGYLKLWSNKLADDQLAKDHVLSEFVTPVGLHHVSAFESIEPNGETVVIVSTASFDGKIHFYEFDIKEKILSRISLIQPEEEKHSYWACKWHTSNDPKVPHKFIATTVQGTTKVWDFHVFQDPTVNTETGDVDNSVPLKYEPHFEFKGQINSQITRFATAVDVSSENMIATGFSDGTVVVSQLSTLRPVFNFEGFGLKGIDESSSTIRDVKFSPGGSLLAVAHDSGSYGCVSLYETKFGERIGDFTVPTHGNQTTLASYAHNGWVFSISFNTSGEYLASAGYDGKIRIWDTKTRERVSTLNINATDIEIEEDIVLEDEHGDSLEVPPVLGVSFIKEGVRSGMGSSTNEGICCVCSDRSIRWFREAGGI